MTIHAEKTYLIRLYLIRHGETYANRQNLVLGQSESPLTSLGQTQAKLTGQYLNSVSFWKCYSSDQKRAVHTAEYILNQNSNHNVSLLQMDSRLRERAKGAREGRDKYLSKEEAIRLYRLEYGEEVSLPLEENEVQVWNRFQSWLEDILQSRLSDDGIHNHNSVKDDERIAMENILVVSHSGTIRIIMNHFKERIIATIEEDQERNACAALDVISNSMIVPNTSITVIDIPFTGPKSWHPAFVSIMDETHLE